VVLSFPALIFKMLPFNTFYNR